MTRRPKPAEVRRGTDNNFADLGFPDPDTHLLKAELVTRLYYAIAAEGLTQVQTARRLGISQPDVSRMLRGQFRDFSVERLMRFLAALGCKVEIVIKPKGRGRAKASPIRIAA